MPLMSAERPPAASHEGVVLYASATTRVTRVGGAGTHDQRIIKQPLGAGAGDRLRRELAVLERLGGVTGVLTPVPTTVDDTIAFADPGGTALTELLKARALTPVEVLQLGQGVARTLAEVHARGVIHKDINPANIVVRGNPFEVWLIDYDIASPFDEERASFQAVSALSGTVPYMAPEQTGRNARPLDPRADLYSLGATLYAAITGKPPFGTDDPLQIIHDHLARQPVDPSELAPRVPRDLSSIIMRLLEKEPDARYQSAEGLLHDLNEASRALQAGRDGQLQPGARDFPRRLRAPSRLLGRVEELATLRGWFEQLTRGAHVTGFITGERGVGKSTLLDQVRAWVTPVGGLYAATHYDAIHRSGQTDALLSAIAGLLRLLLAEPDDVVATLRDRLRSELGNSAEQAASILPELGLLLQIEPGEDAADLPAAQRLHQVPQQLLRAMSGSGRPIVLVVEDLQWANGAALEALDAIHLDAELSGVLVLGSWRESEVDAAHPLSALVARWQQLGVTPHMLALQPLDHSVIDSLLADTLRLSAARAQQLAADIRPLTNGDPFDTLELVDALRREGILRLADDGWQWDAARVHQHLEGRNLASLVAQRLDALPPSTVALLEALTCLGGEVPIDRLAIAASRSGEALTTDLANASSAGLVLMGSEGEAVRFRNDRVQHAIIERQGEERRTALQLQVARNLAASEEHAGFAAEPYLQVAGQLAADNHTEAARVIALFRGAAGQGRISGNWAQTERYTMAAEEMLAAHPGAISDAEELAALRLRLAIHRHAALYAMGRLADADQVYGAILAMRTDPVRVARANWLQISSLTNRDRPREAVQLALDLLGSLGTKVPATPEAMGAEISRGMDELYAWLRESTEADDLAREPCTDRRVLAAARTINRALPPAYYCDQQVMAWLIVQAGRLWREHGPAAALLGPLSHAAFVTIALCDDYRGGHDIVRRVLNVATARGYELDGAQARFTYALSAAHWMLPLEHGVAEARTAREVLLRGGEMFFAAGVYYALLPNLLGCATTLQELEKEADAAMAYCARVGNGQAGAAFVPYRQFARSLSGLTHAPGSFDGPGFDEAAYVAQLPSNPVAAANYHVTRALAALLTGDFDNFLAQMQAATPRLPFLQATYSMATAKLLHALALAHRARLASGAEREQLVEAFEQVHHWQSARAADSPQNFQHLKLLLDAESAWVRDDFRAAAQHYDNAYRLAPERQRPWHRALILRQAARLHAAQGIEGMAELLRQRAFLVYERWGAAVKASDPSPETQPTTTVRDTTSGSHRTGSLHGDGIDLLAILKAAQQLQTETDPERLTDNISTVLSALSGATAVRLVWWNEETKNWYTATRATGGERREVDFQQAVATGLLPASAFRYAQRTRTPLVVDDALTDDRFLRDPYFSGMRRCALMVVPVLSRGALKAMLVLENRMAQGVFSAQRLDGVNLIAGQLSTAIDNVLLNVAIGRRVEDNERLARLSNTDALTGLANRRSLDARLAEMLEQAAKEQRPVSLAMIDVDHFKRYNDHYGHQAGDECLAAVAAVLARSERAGDLVARYGGEEFVVVLPGTDAVTARRVIDRVHAQVEAKALPHAAAPLGVVTLSIGVAGMVPAGSEDAGRLIGLADAALYKAKQGGRNRVILA